MEEILRTIPHRPPFLFIDRILSVGDEGATTSRTWREDEFFYAGHYPGNPITPGVLLCEAVFQTGAVYLAKRLEKDGVTIAGKTPVLSRIGETKFKNMVRPGDTTEIEVRFKETLSRFHFLRGTVRSNGKVVLTIEFALALIDE